MNKLFDLVKRWAEKLTYRILVMSGASETAKENYVEAVTAQNDSIIERDKELRGKVPLIRIALWGGLGLIVFFAIKWLRDRDKPKD